MDLNGCMGAQSPQPTSSMPLAQHQPHAPGMSVSWLTSAACPWLGTAQFRGCVLPNSPRLSEAKDPLPAPEIGAGHGLVLIGAHLHTEQCSLRPPSSSMMLRMHAWAGGSRPHMHGRFCEDHG